MGTTESIKGMAVYVLFYMLNHGTDIETLPCSSPINSYTKIKRNYMNVLHCTRINLPRLYWHNLKLKFNSEFNWMNAFYSSYLFPCHIYAVHSQETFTFILAFLQCINSW